MSHLQRVAHCHVSAMSGSAAQYAHWGVQIKKGHDLYLTGNKIAELFHAAVHEMWPDTGKEELKQYSAHSLCAWACVLLDEADKSPEYIKK